MICLWLFHPDSKWMPNVFISSEIGLQWRTILGHPLLIHHHHHHQSLNREGRWWTTDDFATSFLHFSLFSTALWDLPNSRPVHSLMLSSHLFLCISNEENISYNRATPASSREHGCWRHAGAALITVRMISFWAVSTTQQQQKQQRFTSDTMSNGCGLLSSIVTSIVTLEITEKRCSAGSPYFHQKHSRGSITVHHSP